MAVLRVKNRASLSKIAETLSDAKSVLIFTHYNIDGDCFGSAMAVCRMLRRKGKNAWILLNQEVPEYLSFLAWDPEEPDASEERKEAKWTKAAGKSIPNESKTVCFPGFADEEERIKALRRYTTLEPETDIPELIKNPEVCLAVDCSDEKRFTKFGEIFTRGTNIVIDHHATNPGYAELSYVNDCAANGENIYRLFRAMDEMPTSREGEAIYSAISTDTGRFQYSQVNAATFRIIASLYECGIDQQTCAIQLFQSDRREKVLLQNRIKSGMEFFAGGRAVLTTMDLATLRETGARMEETEGVVEEARNIKGIEVSCFIREDGEGGCKVSLRSKRDADVSGISVKYGGGGHIHAAGCTIRKPLPEVVKMMREEVETLLK